MSMSFNRLLQNLIDENDGDPDALFDALNLSIPNDSSDESCDG